MRHSVIWLKNHRYGVRQHTRYKKPHTGKPHFTEMLLRQIVQSGFENLSYILRGTLQYWVYWWLTL